MGKIHKVNIAWSTLQCTKNYVWWNVITWYVIWGSKILKSQSLTGEQSHDPQCAEHKSRNGLSVDAALRFQCQHNSGYTTQNFSNALTGWHHEDWKCQINPFTAAVRYSSSITHHSEMLNFSFIFTLNWKSLLKMNWYLSGRFLFIFCSKPTWKKKTCQNLHGC